jgi:hypothetical protein
MPDTDYVQPTSNDLDLWLPSGFTVGTPAAKDGYPNEKDSVLSFWYRGKRYGYA